MENLFNFNQQLPEVEDESINLPHSTTDDIIADVFKIDVNQHIEELSNDFVKYYRAIKSDQANGVNGFFAIAFERNINPNLQVINLLFNAKPSNIICPVAYGVTTFSTSQIPYFVVIVNAYNYKNNLTNYVQQNGIIQFRELSSHFIPFIAELLNFATQKSINNYGNINPHNILLNNDGSYILREPFIAPAHFYQDTTYLGPEIAMCLPIARNNGALASDTFALGVTIFYANNGYAAYAHSSDDDNKTNAISFYKIVGRTRLNDDLKFILKGCLNDSVADRWNGTNITEWMTGKYSRVLSNEANEAVAHISFNGENYSSFRLLANAMSLNWDTAKSFIQEERLLKWIQRNVGKGKNIESFDDLFSKDTSIMFTHNIGDKDDRLFKMISAFDAQGPIRYRNFSTHIFALPNMFLNGLVKQNKHMIDNVMKIITKRTWSDLQSYNNIYQSAKEYFDSFDFIAKHFSTHTAGFGVDRVLYILNPNLPCLSSILSKYYVDSLESMLKALENIAIHTPEKLRFDSHILSFIANKLNLSRDNYVKYLRDFPNLNHHSVLYVISLLALSQTQCPHVKITHLLQFLSKEVIALMNDVLTNVNSKKELFDKIDIAVQEENISSFLKIISNPKMYNSDQIGYNNAKNQIIIINQHIAHLSQSVNIFSFGVLLGQRVTLVLSYVLFLCIALNVLL